jgi:NADPH-dependent curcumin reductase
MSEVRNEQWIFVRRPQGEVGRDCFEVRHTPRPQPGAGQVLVRNIYLMVPASMRLWMDAAPSYFPPQPLGEVMLGGTLGVVEASNAPGFVPGMLVNGFGGWQTYCVLPPEQLMPVRPHPQIELAAYRSVFDVQGLTAWAGVHDICALRAGETVLVTAAAGSVGSLACQLAREAGAQVIGVAGGADKCAWLREVCGIERVIDYKREDVAARLAALAPQGLDCVFENVGGAVFDAALALLNKNARIALCGLVAGYNGAPPPACANLMQLVYKTVRVQGFLVLDYYARLPEIVPLLERLALDGRLRYQLDYHDGLGAAVTAMQKLARGENRGMGVVRISPEPPR